MAEQIDIAPKQLRQESAYLTRNVFVHPNQYRPGVRDGEKWRTVAAEPINRAARRMIQREISSLNWSIVPEDQEDEIQKQAVLYYTDLLKDYRGLVTRILKGVTELPQGGAWEVGWIKPGIFGEGQKGTPSFIQHIDASTLHPAVQNNNIPIQSAPADDIPPTTIASSSAIVQIDPYNPLRRVVFQENQIIRMMSNPYDQFGLSWWQESPTEAAFLAIEGLSRIYVYYLKQLQDTPLTGILDMMDFSEESASQWAKDFRETLEGIDPIKIPILYEHNEPAKWIPMGRNPGDMAINEQFQLFAEMVLTQYGLSISDLRILKSDKDSKAGSAVGNKITMRTGIGYFAELVKDTIQQLLPPFLKFSYTEVDLDDKRNLSQIRASDARTIQTFDWLPVDLKAQQALKWGVLDIPIDPEDVKKEADKLGVGMGGVASPTPGQLAPGEGKVRDKVEDEAKKGAASSARTFAKSLTERAVSRFRVKAGIDTSKYGIKKDIASERLEEALAAAFRQAGRRMTKRITAKLVNAAYTQFPDVVVRNIDDPMEAKSLTEFLDNMGDGDFGDVLYKQDDLRTRIELLMEELLSAESFYSINDFDLVELVMEILSLAYEDGLLAASELVQGEYYAKGIVESPYVDLVYRLVNSTIVSLLRNSIEGLLDLIDSGTKFFLQRALAEGVTLGLGVDEITDGIQAGLFGTPPEEAGDLSRRRIRSIVTTEINRAESQGRLEEMRRTGFKLKTWITRLIDVCPTCIANEAKGSVPLDFEYQDVFGPTLGPPGHPDTCHCALGADADELANIGTTIEFWTGGGGTNDKALIVRAYENAVPKKKTAKNAVGHEVRMGRMIPASERDCARCGKPAQEYHHNDYSSEHVLDVIPLCRSCHKKRKNP